MIKEDELDKLVSDDRWKYNTPDNVKTHTF